MPQPIRTQTVPWSPPRQDEYHPPVGRHRQQPQPRPRPRISAGRLRGAMMLMAAVAGTVAEIALVIGLIAAWPVYTESRTHLVLRKHVAGFDRAADTGPDSPAAERLKAIAGVTSVDTAVYGDPHGSQPSVTIAVGRRSSWNPGEVVDQAMAGFDQQVDFHTGPLGGFIRCAFTRDNRLVGTYCAWADHGSVGIGLFPGRAVPDAGELFGRFRAQITVR